MAVGWMAQWVLNRAGRKTDWTMALVAGLGGSFVGGLIGSLLAGEGFAIRPSGMIGSFVGAVVVTFAWQKMDEKKA